MAVADDVEELAIIDDKELKDCIGSAKYTVCPKAITTEQTYHDFLATLLYHEVELIASQRCQLDVNELHLTKKACKLGFCCWSVTSAGDNYTRIESARNCSNTFIVTLGLHRHIRLWNSVTWAKHSLTIRSSCLLLLIWYRQYDLTCNYPTQSVPFLTCYRLLKICQVSHHDQKHKFKLYIKDSHNSNKLIRERPAQRGLKFSLRKL